MTDGQRLAVCLLVSLCIHYFAGAVHFRHEEKMGSGKLVEQTQTSAPNVILSVGLPLTLRKAGQPTDEGTTPDERRQALKSYVEKVTREVHTRRKITHWHLQNRAGNTLFSLQVDEQGGFHAIHMTRSSGVDALDNAALAAIRATSGVVPRPSCLGRDTLAIALDVKFQYGL
ncbi:MAG: TonB family protein [Desulfovibrio sp.]|uniref:TonB family protein n=1 Tax=Desulfovibrio sp. 7SRBS1 TaxID=3378064 RepID=UPI003B419ACB